MQEFFDDNSNSIVKYNKTGMIKFFVFFIFVLYRIYIRCDILNLFKQKKVGLIREYT